MIINELQLNGIMLAVSGPVHAVRCESITQASEISFFGSPNALSFVAYLKQYIEDNRTLLQQDKG